MPLHKDHRYHQRSNVKINFFQFNSLSICCPKLKGYLFFISFWLVAGVFILVRWSFRSFAHIGRDICDRKIKQSALKSKMLYKQFITFRALFIFLDEQ